MPSGDLGKAAKSAAAALAAARPAEDDGPAAEPHAGEPPPGAPTPAAAPLWTLFGPTEIAAGTAGTWQIQSTAPLIRSRWFVDDVMVGFDRRSLTHRFAASGRANIRVEVEKDPAPRSLSVMVTKAADRPTLMTWQKRLWGTELFRTAVAGVLIALGGYTILGLSFTSLADLFAGFVWGFSADITVAGANALRTQMRIDK